MVLLNLFHNQGRGRPIGGGADTYADKVLGYNPIAYWPLWEPSGGVANCLVNAAQNGTYTNCTLGQTGIGDGETSALFDNDDCYVNLYSTIFRDAFNTSELTIMLWAKVFDVGVWTDGTNRRFFVFRANDENNRILIHKHEDANEVKANYIAASTNSAISDSGHTETGFIHYTLTVSKTAGATGEVKYYVGSSQVGGTQTNLGVFSGNLHGNYTVLGANGLGEPGYWHGYQAHFAVWDSALAQPAVTDLAVVV